MCYLEHAANIRIISEIKCGKAKKIARRRKNYCDAIEKKLEGVPNISLTRRRKRQFVYYV